VLLAVQLQMLRQLLKLPGAALRQVLHQLFKEALGRRLKSPKTLDKQFISLIFQLVSLYVAAALLVRMHQE
jgi:hypothetical protein